MNPLDPAPSSESDDQRRTLITECIERFEVAWNSGQNPQIEDFLPDQDDVRMPLLVELIRIDQELRWKDHERKLLEAYLDEWPHLKTNPEAITALLRSECLTRFFEDDPPNPDEIQKRFPDLSGSINLSRLAWEAEQDGAPHCDTIAEPKNATLAERGPRALLIGQQFGRYRIVGFLGAGSMGAVYRAYDPNLDRDVALKIPQLSEPRQLDRFLREAKLAAKIRHPNICPIYDAEKIDGIHFITMALIDGPTLAERLKKCHPTPDEASDIVFTIASALDHVHSKGIVHRDLKPSNIMFDKDGQLFVMDFGLARGSEHEPRSAGMGSLAGRIANEPSATDSMIGTPAFMSPEQAAGRDVDARSDIYNLGVVLYQLLTGTLPFTGPLARVIHDIVHTLPASPATHRTQVPEKLEAICLKAMAKDPADRFQRAGQFAVALQQFRETKHAPKKAITWRLAVPAAVLALVMATLIFLMTGSGIAELEVPRDAEVSIDGNNVTLDAGHAEVRLAVGEHRFVVTLDGSPLADEPIVIRWRTQRVRKVLSAPPTGNHPGWWRKQYDLGNTRHYPAPSRKRTSQSLEYVDWERKGDYGSVLYVRTGDLDQDGLLEVIFRAASEIVVCDHTGRELWRRCPLPDSELEDLPNFKAGTAGIELVDFDGNGSPEIVTLASFIPEEGYTRSSPVKVVIYEPDDQEIGCTTIFTDVIEAHGEPINCFDFNLDGFPDLVLAVAAYEHPHAVTVYDFVSHETLFTEHFADHPAVGGIGDVNRDGKEELFLLQAWDSHVDRPVGDYDAEHCFATLFDLQGNRIWVREYKDSLDGSLADLDGDGTLDVILFNMAQASGAIHLLDASDGKPRASFTEMGSAMARFWSIADVTGDGRKEIVCGDGSDVLLIDANLKLLKKTPFPNTRVVGTNDLDGDGNMDVLAFQDEKIIVLDRDLATITSFGLTGPVFDAIISDIDNDGINEILAIAGPGKRQIEILRFAPRRPKKLPGDVALKFLRCVRSSEKSTALELVASEAQSTVRQKLTEEIPSIPQNPRLLVEQNPNGTAKVDVENAVPLRVTLRYADSQWQVADLSW